MNTYTNPYRTYDNETELNAYIAHCGEAAEILAQLTEWVENHGDVDPDDVDNQDVRRMANIVTRLRHIRTHAGIEDLR